jgi:hypothetical protein
MEAAMMAGPLATHKHSPDEAKEPEYDEQQCACGLSIDRIALFRAAAQGRINFWNESGTNRRRIADSCKFPICSLLHMGFWICDVTIC